MNEDRANVLCNSFFAYLCQFYMPCNSWAVQLQALVSAAQKTPEAPKPYMTRLPQAQQLSWFNPSQQLNPHSRSLSGAGAKKSKSEKTRGLR